ncbi:MAG: hypothetical protein QM737_18855 [Ferruginibacter sp.]
MTSQESRSIGGKQLLKGGAFIFLIFEIVFMFYETQGDFANGILFFIQQQLNGFFFILVFLFFGIMYFLGRSAGYNILMKERKYLFIGLLYAIIATLIIVCMLALPMFLFRSHDFNYSNAEILRITLRNFVLLFVPMLIIWMWAANKIKLKMA